MTVPAALIAAVRTALDEVEAEYGGIPFPIRIVVKRGFARRTGHDFGAWRAMLDEAARGAAPAALEPALAALAEHYRGSPERARRGMGGDPDDPRFRELVARSQRRAADADELRAALG